jgi:extracellular solute-binding protein (family 3)
MRLRIVSAGVAIASVLALAPLPGLAQQPLKTAVDGTFAPHAMPKLSGGIEGFNVDLANEIGKRLKRPVEISATQFSGILPSLQAGTIDFVAAPVTVTKERAENYLFSEGYLNTDYQFLTKKGEPAITDLKQLKGKSSRSIRARSTTAGRAGSKARSVGSWKASALRRMQCRPSWQGAPTPMSPATRISNMRSNSSPSCSFPTCTRPAWCGRRPFARIPPSCWDRSRMRSNA